MIMVEMRMKIRIRIWISVMKRISVRIRASN